MQPPALTVTVLICSNRPGQSRPAVESVLANTYPRLDLLVVAQGGDWAATDLAVLADDPRLRILKDGGGGLSRARNLGLSAATGDIIVFTDDDCLVAPDWIEAHVALYEERPELAFVFGKVDPPVGSWERDTVPTFDPSAERGSARNTGAIVLGMGANMSMRRSTVRDVGLFDEQLGAGGNLASGEDLDYALRVAATGLLVIADSRPCVIHQGGTRSHGAEAHQLWHRDGVGFGAVAVKRLRAGDWKGALRVARFVSDLARQSLANLAARRTPSGARMASTLLVGALTGAFKALQKSS